MPRILIISSCTKDKNYKGFDVSKLPHTIEELQTNTSNPNLLNKYGSLAKDLYLGIGHKHIKEALDILKNKHIDLNWMILSAGYGLINPDKLCVPYDITFNILTNKQIIESSNKLNIANNVDKAISNNDIVIFALPRLYLKAIQFNKLVNLDKTKTLVFIDNLDSYELNESIYKDLAKANVNVWLLNKHEDNSVEYDCFREIKVKQVAQEVKDLDDLIGKCVKK